MASPLTLMVNGEKRSVTASPDTPLLYVLRNDLQLTGPRFGCGLAQCGACAVLVDGAEMRSCVTPVSTVAGKRVHTIEGLPALWAGRSTARLPATRHSIPSSRPGSTSRSRSAATARAA